MVATPEAYWPSVELITESVPTPPVPPGLMVPPPFAVRLLILIFVDPRAVGDNPMLLPIVTDDGASTDLLIAVTPSDAEILALVPKLVLFPTVKEVLLPFVTDRFSVLLPLAAVGATTVGPVGAIVDCAMASGVESSVARRMK